MSFGLWAKFLCFAFALKVASVKDFLPQACPHGHSMVLDGEVRVKEGGREIKIVIERNRERGRERKKERMKDGEREGGE